MNIPWQDTMWARQFKTRGGHTLAHGASPTPSERNYVGLDRPVARQCIRRIIHSYDDLIIQAYCRTRFIIMNLRFLEEMDQYIPRTGDVLDFGCGFGLFSLYFASVAPSRRLLGVDLNRRRIGIARRCAQRLHLKHVEYVVGDAAQFPVPRGLACVYMLDLLHHLPAPAVQPLLERIGEMLRPPAVLLIKDVDTNPFYKRWFTLLLDRLMVGLEPIRYWPAREMIVMVERAGFQVYTHELRDVLPYPHRLYICRKI